MRKSFPFSEIEPKWQHFWENNQTFRAANPGEPGSEKPKFYALDMFPYPSGAGLHVGHPEGYTATDIVCRYKRMQGFNVLHPMGWDAFGLPAEQYAIQTGQHPRVTTEQNISNFRRQIQSLGFSYDWSRELSTTDPSYFRWTQWIFLQLYKKGLAYVADAPVWYCPALGTVLANEEVLPTEEGPRSERGNYPVERRPLRQWVLKITAYAERLLQDIDSLDWPESLKEMQRNWIGRSEGAEVSFPIPASNTTLSIFTTRPDTLFGATYLVLAPEHPLVNSITTPEQQTKVATYRQQISVKSDLERTELAKEKTGVFTGGWASNPVTQEKIPIWIADYVLMSYGTGAIMAVPAHDERDLAFAQKFDLPVREVIAPSPQQEKKQTQASSPSCFTGEGTAIHSDFLNDLPTAQAKKEIIRWLEQNNHGHAKVQYKLRDWLFSRQRYWGEPFPITWKNGESHPLSEEELPLLLPELDDYQPSPEGLAPLAKATQWVTCPDGSHRETNTMPQWAGSCWYYLRYLDPHNDHHFCAPEIEKYWMQPSGVDLYIGGAEHAVLHLLYARFWHKVLYDLGCVSTPEPFYKLVNQGIILGEDLQKMSKARGNVVNPDEIVSEYGADAFRLFEMFIGPLEQVKPWSSQGVEGVYRFLSRVWRLVMEENQEGKWVLHSQITEAPPCDDLQRSLHSTIQKVTSDIEKLAFNTAISSLMILTNELTKAPQRPRETLEKLILLLAPFSPHLSEELWSQLGHTQSLAHHPWPQTDEKWLQATTIPIVAQVNGKVRVKMTISPEISSEEMIQIAQTHPQIQPWLQDKTILKSIAIPQKLVNFVVK